VDSPECLRVKHPELIATKLSAAGWTWGYGRAVTPRSIHTITREIMGFWAQWACTQL